MPIHPADRNDPKRVRNVLTNAKRAQNDALILECQIRLAELAGLPYDEPLERAFWVAVAMAEELKTAEQGKTIRLNYTKRKHARVGAWQCLHDWALDTKTTDGFRVLVENGRADLTGEAIVIAHADKFPPEVVASAARKLAAAGYPAP